MSDADTPYRYRAPNFQRRSGTNVTVRPSSLMHDLPEHARTRRIGHDERTGRDRRAVERLGETEDDRRADVDDRLRVGLRRDGESRPPAERRGDPTSAAPRRGRLPGGRTQVRRRSTASTKRSVNGGTGRHGQRKRAIRAAGLEDERRTIRTDDRRWAARTTGHERERARDSDIFTVAAQAGQIAATVRSRARAVHVHTRQPIDQASLASPATSVRRASTMVSLAGGVNATSAGRDRCVRPARRPTPRRPASGSPASAP